LSAFVFACAGVRQRCNETITRRDAAQRREREERYLWRSLLADPDEDLDLDVEDENALGHQKAPLHVRALRS
jgi:hypothetical protein